MGDKLLLKIATKPAAGELTDGSVDADAPFIELAHGLESYVYDLLSRPTFHRFLELPTELRYNVYEFYLSDDTRSMSTREWPGLDWTGVMERCELQVRSSAPFLPTLCLLSKNLLKELLPCVMGAIVLLCQDADTVLDFIENATRFQALDISIGVDIDILHHIHRLEIIDVNDMAYRSSTSDDEVLDRKKSILSNRSASTCLNSFKNLREIRRGFHAPNKIHLNGYPLICSAEFVAQPIGGFLEGFNPRSVLQFGQLQKITINCASGKQNTCCHSSLYDFSIFKNDTRDKLQALVDLARRLGDGFEAKGQEVDLEVNLYWSDDMAVYRKFERGL